jgi:hypothetical protein
MKILLLLFAGLMTPCLCYPQQNAYSAKVRMAIETYAFLKGQNSALEMIALQFPSLKKDVTKTSTVFIQAEQNIERFLKSQIGEEFTVLQKRIGTLLHKQFKNPIEKEKYARDFLEKIRQRSRFSSDSLITKGILSFAYEDVPHQEIIDGHTITFTTKGHPKAEKIILQVPIPKSWKAEEAEMPETVQQFTSYGGQGTEKILIVVYDLTQEDRDLTLTEKSILEMIPPEAKLLRTEPTIIDNNPGIITDTEETVNFGNKKMKIRMLQFMFIEKDKLYCLQGSIGPVEVNTNLEIPLKKYEPLFRIVASRANIDN